MITLNDEGILIGYRGEKRLGRAIFNSELELNQKEFYKCFEGNGLIIEIAENPQNPMFFGDWAEIISNTELIPEGAKSVFFDDSF